MALTVQAKMLTILSAQLQTVCPIGGLAINDVNNPATWRIDFDPTATSPQQAAATAMLTQPLVTAALNQASLADNTDAIVGSNYAMLLRKANRLTAAGKTAEALQILLQLQQGGN